MLLNIYINLAGCFFSNSHFLFVKFDYLVVAFHTFDVNITSGGSKGGARDVGPNSFNFMQFLGKFGKIVCWCPPGSWRPLLAEILDPPLITVVIAQKFKKKLVAC